MLKALHRLIFKPAQAAEMELGRIGENVEIFADESSDGFFAGFITDGKINWSNVITTGAKLAIFIAALFMLVQIVIGAFNIMSGDTKKIDDGRKKIVWSIIGLFIVASIFAILIVVQNIIGVDFITFE